MLYRKIVICECGHPAMLKSTICRTCYEDGFRRRWRDELRRFDAGTQPVPTQPLTPRQRMYCAPGRAWPETAGV